MTNRREFLTVSIGLLTAARLPAAGAPKQILLIRHGEKTGDKADMHLNPRGYERAAALPRLFPSQFDTPQFIFATHASDHSNRPVETVTPLASALHLQINSQFANEEYSKLAKELLSNSVYGGKTVLVCWHHGNILAQALGVPHPPSPWPDTQFDHVWKIEGFAGTVTLTDAPQRLLPGDS